MAMFSEKTIGVPGYGANVSYYVADIDITEVTTTGKVYPLFVVPKGVTIIGAKATTVDSLSTGGTAPSYKVGTYAITDTGTTGAAFVDGAADVFATLTTGAAGSVVGAVSGATKLYTADAVVGLTVTTAGVGTGKIRIELFGVC